MHFRRSIDRLFESSISPNDIAKANLNRVNETSFPEKLNLIRFLHFEFSFVRFHQRAIGGSKESCTQLVSLFIASVCLIEYLIVFSISIQHQIINLVPQKSFTCIIVNLILLSKHQVFFPCLLSLPKSEPFEQHLNEDHNVRYDDLKDYWCPPNEFFLSEPFVTRNEHEGYQ